MLKFEDPRKKENRFAMLLQTKLVISERDWRIMIHLLLYIINTIIMSISTPPCLVVVWTTPAPGMIVTWQRDKSSGTIYTPSTPPCRLFSRCARLLWET